MSLFLLPGLPAGPVAAASALSSGLAEVLWPWRDPHQPGGRTFLPGGKSADRPRKDDPPNRPSTALGGRLATLSELSQLSADGPPRGSEEGTELRELAPEEKEGSPRLPAGRLLRLRPSHRREVIWNL